ncbi:hypothetical protein CGSMWGv00703Dmash_00169 [Gardnerella greenwoodii 00703Dmash]|uniref:Uncharacterized protein n=1 Tax=Gardnerella greenwoodii 00703Dmash TaxID=698960 RepID=I4MBU8_9BIFI|nr:hypothetical protein CGSMWGv00703Dmash_00169 [Gardnerella greenwoodii 00703Dmash]
MPGKIHGKCATTCLSAAQRARKQFGAETRSGWKSSGLPTRVSQASA